MRIDNIPAGVVALIVLVLLISLSVLAQPTAVYNSQPVGCTIDLFGQSRSGVCVDSLSVASGAPGTMVTVSISDFGDTPLDVVGSVVGYQNPSISYSISLAQIPSLPVLAASGNLTCDTLSCTANSPAAVFMNSGSFSYTFSVPKVSPGTYNVIVTVAYTSPTGSYISTYSPTFDESATATFTVT